MTLVLRISMAHVLLPTLYLQREAFSPKVLSLVMSFEDTMVLNTEL